VCSASHFSFVIGILLVLLAFSVPIYGKLLREAADRDLSDLRRQANAPGLRALIFRIGFPLVWMLYLPAQGFVKTLLIGGLLMLPPLLFCG
jgi:hypothetical protein